MEVVHNVIGMKEETYPVKQMEWSHMRTWGIVRPNKIAATASSAAVSLFFVQGQEFEVPLTLDWKEGFGVS